MKRGLLFLVTFGIGTFLSADAVAFQLSDLLHEEVNSVGQKLVLVSPCSFQMGSPETEKDRFKSEQQHEATVSRPFYLSHTEVTQRQWKLVMGTEPWKGQNYTEEGDDYPAVNISWYDAVDFCKKLTASEDRVYRLPTDAEWELACRGGTITAFSFGSDAADLAKYGWFFQNTWSIGKKHAQKVSQKLPNPFGLYDMHGNVGEWCSDERQSGFHVVRSGSFVKTARQLRSASSDRLQSGIRSFSVGFRVASNFDIMNSVGQELALIPAGSFMMGSPSSDEDRKDDETEHNVILSKSFYMGRTEVTRGQWRMVMGTEPWTELRGYVDTGDDYAVTNIKWYDALAFCEKLSDIERRTYRLPTEAEWEYACRAGSKTRFSFGNDYAELDRNGFFEGTEWYAGLKHVVAQKRANAFSLYDMHGNCWEWCNDWYGEYPPGSVTDPQGPDSGLSRVLRGGSINCDGREIRSANRWETLPKSHESDYGFRLVLEK